VALDDLEQRAVVVPDVGDTGIDLVRVQALRHGLHGLHRAAALEVLRLVSYRANQARGFLAVAGLIVLTAAAGGE
jgi:hypothetical protein